MTLYKIAYSQEAFNDLNTIYRYIATESLDLRIAERFVKKLKNAIESLRTFPSRHPKIEGSFRGSVEVRQFVADSYLILYIVDNVKKTIIIIGIISCKQDKTKVIN